MAHEALYTRGRPKTLSHLIGQEHISNALARAISTNRLSHAYLLVGTRGTGKTSTARLLAKALNCDRVYEAQKSGRALEKKEIPCNKCDACKNFDSSQDNVEFDAASNRSVEDVTRLLSTAHFAPLRARVKTFIIDEVHMLSFEAVNSILKLIEEPPPNVAFFLATTELNKVPMTIRSRCQVLNFRLIPQTLIAPYLVTLAKRLNVTLNEDAAKKIARLAEGSMRDALTYLDQCYAVSEGEITLAQVNETLGLISDENLDDIISAIRERDRVEVAKAVTRAFSSGLAANVIAESLITRLRDIEFDMLDRNESNLADFDRIIDSLREATREMYGSGIPDIILEMALMKLAAPAQNFIMPMQNVITPAPIPQATEPAENLDAGQKIFYDTKAYLNSEVPSLKGLLDQAVVTSFSDGMLTLGFRSPVVANGVTRSQKDVENAATHVAGRPIKISVVIDKNLPPPVLMNMPEKERSNLAGSMKTFNASDAVKISVSD